MKAKQVTKKATATLAHNPATFDPMAAQVRDTLQVDSAVADKWLATGGIVKAYYVKRDNLEADKERLITAAIVPILSDKHREALKYEIPHASGKVYKSMSVAEKAGVDAKKEAKRNADKTVHAMFARVVDYAFPKEAAPKASKSKLQKAHDALVRFRDLIQACEKAPFSIPEAVTWSNGKIAAMLASLPKSAQKKAAPKKKAA
jgi:hypothetical protein